MMTGEGGQDRRRNPIPMNVYKASAHSRAKKYLGAATLVEEGWNTGVSSVGFTQL
ncbi:MAG: hypothetical protein ACOC38_11830 [Promethearchaeia archaeon]